eukprot:1020078-Lingulodinium_polyedra.AAC.1
MAEATLDAGRLLGRSGLTLLASRSCAAKVDLPAKNSWPRDVERSWTCNRRASLSWRLGALIRSLASSAPSSMYFSFSSFL